VADERGSSLNDLYQAATIGQTVFRAIAEALPMSSHYPRGWHSTATIGRIAGTLAVARLVGLSSAKTTHAIGIAASMAAGSIANFGTMTKPLHAGQAAQDAVLAVQLAEAGLTSNESQLDHSKGFFALFGDPERDRSDLVARLKFWEENWTNDVSFKRYPSCYGTHRAIDGMLKIRDQIGAGDEITGIEVMVHLVGLEPLIAHFPKTGLEAKFNLAYTVGLAAIEGSVVLADFDGDWTCPDDVRKLMDVTTVTTAPFPPDKPEIDGEPFSRVIVHTGSGNTFAETVVFTRGDARNPMSDEELLAKMVSCGMSGGFSRAGVDALGQAVLSLYPHGNISDVQQALKDVSA
jgi:2-methylcitrate dehydratase PrpD